MAQGAVAAITLRGAGVPTAMWLKRVVSAVVSIPAFAWVVSGAPAWVFPLLVVAVSAAASWELARMLEHAGRPTYRWLGVIGAAALTASFATPTHATVPLYPALVLATLVGAILSGPLWTRAAPTTEPVANTLLGLIYVGWLLGYAVWLHASLNGAALVLFLVGVTWAGESAAYAVGSAIGRHRLAPRISPGKTVEGALAQFGTSVGAALVLAPWLLPECAPARAAVAGALIGSLGQIGDLAESVMKRSAGVKDASDLIPGHGGLLDRIDSLLFTAPAFYYYSAFVGCGR